MTLKEQLQAKKNELLALKSDIEAGNVESIAKAGELADAIAELEASIASAQKANDILKTMGTPAAEEDETVKSGKVSGMKSLFAQAKSVNKANRGWSISADFKAATDVITSLPVVDVDKNITPQPKVAKVSSLLGNATLNGTSVTYFTENAFEGDIPDVVSEGAKKPQGSMSYEPKTEALVKIAGYIKETDEVLEDNAFLASAIEDVMLYRLAKRENTYVVNKIKNDVRIGNVTYDSSSVQALAEGIFEAKTKINSTTPYTADVVLLNPTDYFNLAVSKDANGQYLGGGYFQNAYGNGNYSGTYSIWGLNAFVDSNVDAGEPIVMAGKEAVKFYLKNGASVRVYEQNEDDAIHNRVTVLAEERALVVVKTPAAVVKLTAEA